MERTNRVDGLRFQERQNLDESLGDPIVDWLEVPQNRAYLLATVDTNAYVTADFTKADVSDALGRFAKNEKLKNYHTQKIRWLVEEAALVHFGQNRMVPGSLGDTLKISNVQEVTFGLLGDISLVTQALKIQKRNTAVPQTIYTAISDDEKYNLTNYYIASGENATDALKNIIEAHSVLDQSLFNKDNMSAFASDLIDTLKLSEGANYAEKRSRLVRRSIIAAITFGGVSWSLLLPYMGKKGELAARLRAKTNTKTPLVSGHTLLSAMESKDRGFGLDIDRKTLLESISAKKNVSTAITETSRTNTFSQLIAERLRELKTQQEEKVKRKNGIGEEIFSGIIATTIEEESEFLIAYANKLGIDVSQINALLSDDLVDASIKELLTSWSREVIRLLWWPYLDQIHISTITNLWALKQLYMQSDSQSVTEVAASMGFTIETDSDLLFNTCLDQLAILVVKEGANAILGPNVRKQDIIQLLQTSDPSITHALQLFIAGKRKRTIYIDPDNNFVDEEEQW